MTCGDMEYWICFKASWNHKQCITQRKDCYEGIVWEEQEKKEKTVEKSIGNHYNKVQYQKYNITDGLTDECPGGRTGKRRNHGNEEN